MDGLIVKQPFAEQLVTGKKEMEYRTTPLPKNKTNQEILILTPKKDGCWALGTVFFTSQNRIGYRDYEWIVDFPVKYDGQWQYKQKQGCVTWVKDVEFEKENTIQRKL